MSLQDNDELDGGATGFVRAVGRKVEDGARARLGVGDEVGGPAMALGAGRCRAVGFLRMLETREPLAVVYDGSERPGSGRFEVARVIVQLVDWWKCLREAAMYWREGS